MKSSSWISKAVNQLLTNGEPTMILLWVGNRIPRLSSKTGFSTLQALAKLSPLSKHLDSSQQSTVTPIHGLTSQPAKVLKLFTNQPPTMLGSVCLLATSILSEESSSPTVLKATFHLQSEITV